MSRGFSASESRVALALTRPGEPSDRRILAKCRDKRAARRHFVAVQDEAGGRRGSSGLDIANVRDFGLGRWPLSIRSTIVLSAMLAIRAA